MTSFFSGKVDGTGMFRALRMSVASFAVKALIWPEVVGQFGIAAPVCEFTSGRSWARRFRVYRDRLINLILSFCALRYYISRFLQSVVVNEPSLDGGELISLGLDSLLQAGDRLLLGCDMRSLCSLLIGQNLQDSSGETGRDYHGPRDQP